MSDDYWKMRKAYAQMNGTAAHEEAQKRRAERALAPKPRLPLHLLWGRIEETGQEFVAIASSIPHQGFAKDAKAIHRAFATRELAEAGLKKLLVELGDAVRSAGGRVTDVETDGV